VKAGREDRAKAFKFKQACGQKFFPYLPSQKQKTHHRANTEVLEGVGIGGEIQPDKMPDHEGMT